MTDLHAMAEETAQLILGQARASLVFFIKRALAKLQAEHEAELADARFSPMGDNHHNALVCPYCNPDRPIQKEAMRQAEAERPAAVAEALERAAKVCKDAQNVLRETADRQRDCGDGFVAADADSKANMAEVLENAIRALSADAGGEVMSEAETQKILVKKAVRSVIPDAGGKVLVPVPRERLQFWYDQIRGSYTDKACSQMYDMLAEADKEKENE